MFQKDSIYQYPTDVIDFDFDEKIAQVFPDMVHRSIPGYAALLTVMQAIFQAELAHHTQPLIYDLGCSVGGVTMALANVLSPRARFIRVDISPEMLKQYQQAIQKAQLSKRVTVTEHNIIDYPLKPCQGIAINFTLQFLPPSERQVVLDKAYQALENKGLLFIAEKTTTHPSIATWHEQFKRNNGYSELEITQKRLAIEKVMLTDDEKTITKRCQTAGFSSVFLIFQALGFNAWVMQK